MDEKVTIVGAGPAGMAAAIYLQRAGLAPVILERGAPGGLLRSAGLVENYPGFPDGIRGVELVEKIKRQLRKVGARITKANVVRVAPSAKGFAIQTDKRKFTTQAVLIATGTSPKGIHLQGPASVLRKKVFNEIIEIPGRVYGKKILIIGGGDAAFDYALNLEGQGANVTIITRSAPHCLRLLQERVKVRQIKMITGARPGFLKGSPKGLILQSRMGGQQIETAGDLILLACGRTPNLDILSPDLRRRLASRTDVPRTGVQGLYLVGDVARGNHRQTGIAVGDGIRAAMLAQDYLGRRPTR